MGVAARAEYYSLRAALVDWTIADQPHIAGDQVAIGIENLFQMRRAGFFLAFPHKANVRCKRNMRSVKRIQGGELREDCCLVVGTRPRIDTLLAIYIREARLKWAAADPVGRRDRLTVVVRIEDDGMLGIRRANLAVDDRRSIWNRQQSRIDAALLEHRRQCVGIAANVFRIAGNIRNSKQSRELIENLLPMSSRPIVRCLWCGL